MTYPAAETPPYTLYVGTYAAAEGGGAGLYALTFHRLTGRLGAPQLVAKASNPSFFVLDAKQRFLYAVNEQFDENEGGGGTVSAFAMQGDVLTAAGLVRSGGGAPCHLALSPNGAWLCVANYLGTVAVLPVKGDGALGEPAQTVRHEGSGPNKQRQQAAHPHAVRFSPDGRYLLVADLGADRIVGYAFCGESGRLEPAPGAGALARPGAGPRQLTFHPSGEWAFVTGELDSSLTAYRYDPATGRLDEAARVSAAPASAGAVNYPAEVVVHPSGRSVYTSNRGNDSVALHAFDPRTGALEPRSFTPTQGEFPRHFTIDERGEWLIVANQLSGSLLPFRIGADGALTQAGAAVELAAPACLQLVE